MLRNLENNGMEKSGYVIPNPWHIYSEFVVFRNVHEKIDRLVIFDVTYF